MIHFTHARRLRREEKHSVPPSHNAKMASEYLSLLQRSGISEAKELYGELCELSHPSASSVRYMFSPRADGGFQLFHRNDEARLSDLLVKYRVVFHAIPEVSFNPVLLGLLVFQQFDLFPPIPEISQINFSDVGGWDKIENLLSSSSGEDKTLN